MRMESELVALTANPKNENTLLTLVVCRDCCCGTVRKHPDFDHAKQLELIECASELAGAKVRISTCLDECEHSNVVVVRRRNDAREAVWFGGVLDMTATEVLTKWISRQCADGVPELLQPFVFTPKKEVK